MNISKIGLGFRNELK